jgi:hypothetical protein
MIVPLFVGREKSVKALEEVMVDDKQILLSSQIDPSQDDPSSDGIYNVGVLANVLQLLKLPDGTVKVLVEGRMRVKITEYIENSTNLYTFAAKNISQTDPGDKSSRQIKKQLASQIATIVAGLHRANLWHRDAKTGNFLVTATPAGGIEVMLVDMDGIKPYLAATEKRRYFAFTKLGSVLMWHKGINLTDYLRSVRIYCNLSKVDKHKGRKIFRRLCRSAIALRLLTFAASAMKK